MKSVIVLAGTVLCAVSPAVLGAQLAPIGQNVFTCELKSINLEEGHTLMVGN